MPKSNHKKNDYLIYVLLKSATVELNTKKPTPVPAELFTKYIVKANYLCIVK